MYVPINIKSHYSTLQAISQPHHIEDRLKEIGCEKFAICDISNVSGAVQFSKFDGFTPGAEFTIKDTDKKVFVIAKNLAGWKKLIWLVAQANTKENFPCLPRVDLESAICDDIIPIYMYAEISPAKNSYVGIDINNKYGLHLRRWAEEHGRNTICMHSSYIAREDQLEDYLVVLSNRDNIRIDKCREKYADLLKQPIHILSESEARDLGYTEQEIHNTGELISQCEQIKLTRNPIIPKFSENPRELVEKRCFANLARRNLIDPIYKDRVDEEIDLFDKLDLLNYFLVLADILDYTRRKFGLTGAGRGSAGGCLIAYLMDITAVDPLEYDLLLSRFYNAGRITEDNISPPDIDIDVPAESREDVIEYIKNKYGHPQVGQILTYQTMKGAGALKAVFRAHDSLSFEEVNTITKRVPLDSKISDKMKAEGEESIIKFCLRHYKDDFSEWAFLDDGGSVKGEYAELFDQAMRLEKTKIAQSKHAAGIVIAPEPLDQLCPLIYDDKSGEPICGMEMYDLEAIGMLKLDLLGLRALDKILDISDNLYEKDFARY